MTAAARLLAFLLICSQALYPQSDWPMGSYDKEQTSWARSELSFAPPFDMRVIQLPDPVAAAEGRNSPYLIYSQGMLYIAVNHTPNWLVPLDPEDGTSPWYGVVTGSCCSVGTSPAATGNIVVQGGHGLAAMLTAFDRESGQKLWEKPTGSMYNRNVVLDENRIYYRLEAMTCLAAGNGEVIWSIQHPGYANVGTPAVDDMNAYYTYEDTLFSVDKLTGKKKWHLAGAGHEGLCVDGQHVYLSDDAAVKAVDKYTGALAWQHDSPGGYDLAFINGNSIAIDDRRLAYMVWANEDSVSVLTVLDKTSGAFQWTHTFGGEGCFAPTIANGIIYIVNWETGALYGLDMDNGDVVFKEESRRYSAQPIVANGTMYVNSPNSDATGLAVVAFTPRASAAARPHAPADHRLEIHPRPVTVSSVVSYTLPSVSAVKIDVYNVLGNRIALVHNATEAPGAHSIFLNRDLFANAGAGPFFLRLTVNGSVNTVPFVTAF